MASKDRQYDSFTRGEKREGGKRGTYTKNVSRNAAQKGRAMLSKSLMDVLLCLIVPPYGIYRVWVQEKNEPLFKVACTFLAMAIIFLWCLLIIPEGKPDKVEAPRVRATAIEP